MMVYLRILAFVAAWCAAVIAAPATGQKAAAEAKPAEQKALDPELQVMSPLDVKDADIQDVVRTISKGYNLNIVLDKDVAGKVTVHLSDVPVIEGLRTLAKSIGLEVSKEGNVYRIRKASEEQRSAISFTRGRLTVDVQNMDVKEFLKDISAKTAISIVPDSKVEGKISGKLYQVELDDGLRALLEGSGLKLVKRRNIYQVFTGDGTPASQGGGTPSPYPGFQHGSGGRSGASTFNVDYSNGKISLDVTNGNLQDVIKAISEQSEMQIITYGTVSGDINAKLRNVPLTQALALLLGGTMFTFVQKDSIILIGDRNAATPAGQALSKSELIRLNCIKADGVMQILPKDIPPNNVKVIKEQNALLVSGTSEDIVSVREFINTIDVPTPQVSINAVIVEYTQNLDSHFGASAGKRPNLIDSSYFFHPTPAFARQSASDMTDIGTSGKAIREFLTSSLGLGPTNTLVSKIPEDFFLFLQFLESEDKAKVLAQPSIVTLNGNKASITVKQTNYYKVTTGTVTGTDYTIRFQPIDFGIKLEITPWISMGGQITAEISPEVSNEVNTNADGYPNLSVRSISTTVRLKDGETIILGGLVQNQESQFKQKIPFFGDIPFIGRLFSYTGKTRSKSNLVVYITPHILTKESYVNLGEELKNLEKTNKKFMDGRIEDSINEKTPAKAVDSTSSRSRAPAAAGDGEKWAHPKASEPPAPATPSPVQKDSVRAR
jgi:type IV pilus assembly protein PilQ